MRRCCHDGNDRGASRVIVMPLKYARIAAEAAARARANKVKRDAERDWKAIAKESLSALRSFDAFWKDLSKTNPGFMGRLGLQDYSQMSLAMLQTEQVLKKYRNVK